MQERMKERIEYSKAKKLVKELRESMLGVLKRSGLPVEVGQVDLDGEMLTEEKVEEFKTELDKAFWEGLRQQYIIKETISRSAAKELFDVAKKSLFQPFEKRGIQIKEGETDLNGKPFTKERIEKINQELDGGIWGIINDLYEIVDDEVSP